MTLISMLLALIIERLAVRSDKWQAAGYCRAYVRFSASSKLSLLASHRLGQYLWLALPGAVVALLLCLADSHLLSLLVNTLVLLLGIGCWHYRVLYKQYLNAMDRGDEEAAFISMQQIRSQMGSTQQQNSYGQLLLWLNFRYYAAVVFWFLVLSPFGLAAFGVMTYVLVRHLQEAVDEQDSADYAAVLGDDSKVNCIAHWALWFPARLFGLGFALVGHFSRASNVLLSYFLDFTADNEQVVVAVATAAETLPDESLNTLDDSSYMVQLAKRNMLFFLAFTAILTLTGWLG
ncbi:MAG: regulatory signaling modulator protein AmpE [Gammaproteobacteria bacterium]|nr:regulatory signaling modulator protein AmpE [Gammaproteobacteria bacterium]MBU1555320.1 regulatory signaling modulator protein AmpE [Gammaproteobacteria bacterium]MBU2072477.1 regulatory signaling modulator protein AmpE [Gammaproteobacteria bacterium]MBU2181402.1 regulatory signaling modulator protein AmpE [Gammaproteobacteria bacterium]MBU2204274.1 regulatory signaling modulator protein AmpE [Gammaproteobacteria bacterium]